MQITEGSRVQYKGIAGTVDEIWRDDQSDRAEVLVDMDDGTFLVAHPREVTPLGDAPVRRTLFYSWPAVDQDAYATESGDLAPMVQEAFGHALDCGRTYAKVSNVLSYIEQTYDGGLAEFARHTLTLTH